MLAPIDLHVFADGYRVNRRIAMEWLSWQGLVVTIESLASRGLVRADGSTAHVIWPHTFREDVVALDVEFRLGQSPPPDEDEGSSVSPWSFPYGSGNR